MLEIKWQNVQDVFFLYLLIKNCKKQLYSHKLLNMIIIMISKMKRCVYIRLTGRLIRNQLRKTHRGAWKLCGGVFSRRC